MQRYYGSFLVWLNAIVEGQSAIQDVWIRGSA